MNKVIIAIDSFKGCMTSAEANEVAENGVLKGHPEADVECFNVSDGGEGFLEAMRPDEIVQCHVHDAMMRWTDSAFGIKDGKAIIEVAKAVGLTMIEPEKRNPLLATSYGVGELMVQASLHGCKEFIVGLGGSATSDCGLGMLKCLKKYWQMESHKMWYEPFDTDSLRNIKVILATDVNNPLCGENGAARIYAPQKGADEGMVEKLERRAMTFSRMAAQHQGRDMSNTPGAGAAGGLGYAFMEFMDAKVESGAELVMKTSGLAQALRGADIAITGEGSSDGQTLMDKWPAVLLKHAKEDNVPVMLFAGKIADKGKLLEAGFANVVCINDGHNTTEDPLMFKIATKRLELSCQHCIEF